MIPGRETVGAQVVTVGALEEELETAGATGGRTVKVGTFVTFDA